MEIIAEHSLRAPREAGSNVFAAPSWAFNMWDAGRLANIARSGYHKIIPHVSGLKLQACLSLCSVSLHEGLSRSP